MRRERRAYTLMEVVLVLGVLVILAGLTLPLVDAMQAGPRLAAATDLMHARLNEARTHAVEDHQPYRFSIKQGGSNFRIAPDTSDFWDDGNSSAPKGDGSWVYEGSLPGKVSFVSSDGSPGGDWFTVATFQPDGSASDDVEFTFQTNGAAPKTLRLRGPTGTVTTASLAAVLNVQ